MEFDFLRSMFSVDFYFFCSGLLTEEQMEVKIRQTKINISKGERLETFRYIEKETKREKYREFEGVPQKLAFLKKNLID